ncbi:LysR family transcriptional regulator [Klebsiella michiganensis]|uniref:LysR family transcriptional regulator n=1 Tax=Klebsiella michiganensis TaxID=1134687 RepID=A0A7H4M7C8_9ENTR|nr:LysR family transcriptional regulator [Klebsiella michiganensis]
MLNLQRMNMFVAVVDSGSFTAAATALGQTKAVVSFTFASWRASWGLRCCCDRPVG